MKTKKEGTVICQNAVNFENTLYPDRVESNAAGILTAFISVAAAIVALVLIVSNFSYASHPERYAGNQQAAQNAETENYEENYEGNLPDSAYSDDQYQSAEDQTMNTDTQPYADMQMPEGDGEYVLPQSGSRYLTVSDISGLSAEQLSIARNEIYARHGRLFKDEKIQAYFNEKDWYEGTVQPDDFTLDMLNDYEIANGQLILEYEKEMGFK